MTHDAGLDAFTTQRPTVLAMEDLLGQTIPVLDHGFIRVIDYMGDDAAIVDAARVSYGQGTRRISNDRGLIHYLMRHWHSTPFEMAEIKVLVKLPIFVARQWIRHRTASVNEISGRYSVLDTEFYVPAPDQIRGQSTTNRQGRGELLGAAEAERVLRRLRIDGAAAMNSYEHLLDDDLARELARINLPLSAYTQWVWKTDLHNLMNFIRLRADSHAQVEIAAYANVLLNVMRQWVPLAHEAFLEHRLHAVTLSKSGFAVLLRMIGGEEVDLESSGLPRREWLDLQAALEDRGEA